MRNLMLLMCVSFLMLVFYELRERKENTLMIEAECTKTEMMFKSYKGGWRHVYDCSGKDI